MIFIDSFAKYASVDDFRLNWDGVSLAGSLAFANTTDPKAGAKSIVLVGESVLYKTLGSSHRPLHIAFRLQSNMETRLSFYFQNHFMGSWRVYESNMVVTLTDSVGTEKTFRISETSEPDATNHWEIVIISGTIGSISFYQNGILGGSLSGNYFVTSNSVDSFYLKTTDPVYAKISDFCVDDKSIGQLSVDCYWPTEDIITEWLPGVDHFQLLNNIPYIEEENITSNYGKVDILRYLVNTLNMTTIRAISLNPLVAKASGLGVPGVGIKGVERKRGDNYIFGHVHPDETLRYKALITESLPSRGGDILTDDIKTLDLGLVVTYD